MPYTPATAATLKLSYPVFASTPDETIEYWLTDAIDRIVKPDEWADPDGPVAQMLVAAHNMARGGVGGASGLGLPAGVTSMRSGGLSLSFDAGTVTAQAGGGWTATPYGAQYLALLRLARGGARTTSLGMVECGGWSRLSGLHPSY